MKYVYCLTKDNVKLPKDMPSGICNSCVQVISVGGLSAFFSDVDCYGLDADTSNVISHQKVVDVIFKASYSIIPCRFATLFTDIEDITILLKENRNYLNEYISKLEDKVEVSIKVLYTAENLRSEPMVNEKAKKKSGINYLMAKKQKYNIIEHMKEKSEQLMKRLNKTLEPHWSKVSFSGKSLERVYITNICYLVRKDELSVFENTYQQFRKNNPELRLLYAGPWPPYTFVDIDLSKGLE